MGSVTPGTLGILLREWFSISIIPHQDVNFEDSTSFRAALDEFYFDYLRYFAEEEIEFEKLISRPELIGILLYRLARLYFLSGKEDTAKHFSLLGRFLSGFEIYYSAQIGRGFMINHGLGTVVGARVVIGENVLVHQNVTFGDKNGGRPRLGNNVVVYAGAKVLGPITIGDNAVLGANCVCFDSLPNNAVAAGIPAKIVKYNK